MLRILLSIILLASTASAATPNIFFTDLDFGINQGGENNSGFAGSFVTIFGNNFGSSQGGSTVTWNGLNCLRVVPSTGSYTGWGQTYLWYQKIIVQLGSSCTAGTGNFVITVNGTASSSAQYYNHLQSSTLVSGARFTVVSTGNIRFVAAGGNNGNAGSAASPWAQPDFCKGNVGNGGICYIKGVDVPSATDGGNAPVTFGNPCPSNAPCGFVVYPGSSSIVGTYSVQRGLETCSGLSVCFSGTGGDYWEISGFDIRANNMAADFQTGHNRFTVNHVSCQNVANGTAEGCYQTEFSNGSFQVVLGNEIGPGLPSGCTGGAWPCGGVNAGKLYHNMYFGADGHDFEVGWNESHDIAGGRGMQWFNSGVDTSNVNLHDNVVFNTNCDGIVTQANTANGYENIFNNVIFHAGVGPNEGSQDSACIHINDTSTVGNPVLVYNNTLYDCGTTPTGVDGMLSVDAQVKLTNNIIVALAGEQYITSNVGNGLTNLQGSNNVWSGAGNGPTQTTGNINSSPGFVSAGSDFHLALVSSPANSAGTASLVPTYDHDGLLRANPPAVGAYEFAAASQLIQTAPAAGFFADLMEIK